MSSKSLNLFKKLKVPTRQDKNYLLKYRTYSPYCEEELTFFYKQKPVENKELNENPTNTNLPKKPFNYRTMLCKFFLVNACARGDSCAYSHDTTQFPCKAHFVRKNCKRKNCQFSHNPETLDKLDESTEDNSNNKIDSPFF